MSVWLERSHRRVYDGAQWDLLSAGTLIVAVPILLLIALLQKQFTNSFLSSGIK